MPNAQKGIPDISRLVSVNPKEACTLKSLLYPLMKQVFKLKALGALDFRELEFIKDPNPKTSIY